MNPAMVQYGIWPNCCNNCKFCLRKQRINYTKEQQLFWIKLIKENISYIDWKDKFSYGISILGGEVYFIRDKDVQEAYLDLIDTIIEKILKVSKNSDVKYSTVTNGIYNPEFLYKVIDKIVSAVGIKAVDVNFSYDLKYRFKNEEDRKLVLKNINEFHKRYDYNVGVQMILTQYVINAWKKGKFDVKDFLQNEIPGNQLAFLYPHPVATGEKLNDFFFKRNDFIEFVEYLKTADEQTYLSFMHSTKNSGTFKYTGLVNKKYPDPTEQPILADGKEILNPKCGHSILYQCYTDSDRCALCDLEAIDPEIFV